MQRETKQRLLSLCAEIQRLQDELRGRLLEVETIVTVGPKAVFQEFTLKKPMSEDAKTATMLAFAAKLDAELAAHEKAIESFGEPLTAQVGTLSIPPTWFRMQGGGFINLQNLRSAWPQLDGSMTVYHGEQRFDLSGDDALRLTYRLTLLAADEQQRSGDPLTETGLHDPT